MIVEQNLLIPCRTKWVGCVEKRKRKERRKKLLKGKTVRRVKGLLGLSPLGLISRLLRD
jgi:hypothetical protein